MSRKNEEVVENSAMHGHPRSIFHGRNRCVTGNGVAQYRYPSIDNVDPGPFSLNAAAEPPTPIAPRPIASSLHWNCVAPPFSVPEHHSGHHYAKLPPGYNWNYLHPDDPAGRLDIYFCVACPPSVSALLLSKTPVALLVVL